MHLLVAHRNNYGVFVCIWMVECVFHSNFDDITTVGWIHVNIINLIISLLIKFLIDINYMQTLTSARMKLAIFLVHSRNNLLLDEVVLNFKDYWKDQEKRRKALVKCKWSLKFGIKFFMVIILVQHWFVFVSVVCCRGQCAVFLWYL